MPPAEGHHLENAVLNLKTAVAGIVILVSSIVAGTWFLADAANAIEANAEDIDELEEKQDKDTATIQAIDKKFDRLFLELEIREVISAPAARADRDEDDDDR